MKRDMKRRRVVIGGVSFPVVSLNTLIIGSGAAALNAAVRLDEYGQKEIAIATDRFGGGTSANTGSDKQTYYRLSPSGRRGDSARAMARDYFSGGCMHGDIALCEAENSAASFFHLTEMGISFPHDRFGGYPGYRTDHDSGGRGTSAGPLTSQQMVECLAREVRRRRIVIFDGHSVIALLTDGDGPEKKVVGAIAIACRRKASGNPGFVLFNACNVILATGGPAGMYRSSVYPESQTGSTGMALAIGAAGQNLTESQFGLASTKFRWNLSGSYQQAIPRYFSTDRKGKESRDFLADFFPSMNLLSEAIFKKGYEWPFDARKVFGYGSSLIDLLVFHEIHIRRRRVFLDFRKNPSGFGRHEPFSLSSLPRDVRRFLEKSGALKPTPIERLERLNPPAIEVFRKNGIDIGRDPLEIDVCVQHHNGGLKGNLWWESNIRHLFPVGEVNGSHGVYRPGGAALNAGQVGGMRAARFISRRYNGKPVPLRRFCDIVGTQVGSIWDLARSMAGPASKRMPSVDSLFGEIGERMSSDVGIIRSRDRIEGSVRDAWKLQRRLQRGIRVQSAEELPDAFRVLDLCLTHIFHLEAVREYLEKGGRSRGSFLVPSESGEIPVGGLPDAWKFVVEERDSFVSRHILELSCSGTGEIEKRWLAVRPIPPATDWFETVWSDYRSDRIVIE